MPFWRSSSEGTDSSSDEGKWIFHQAQFIATIRDWSQIQSSQSSRRDRVVAIYLSNRIVNRAMKVLDWKNFKKFYTIVYLKFPPDLFSLNAKSEFFKTVSQMLNTVVKRLFAFYCAIYSLTYIFYSKFGSRTHFYMICGPGRILEKSQILVQIS